MKIAITGKGGVGKTTLSSIMGYLYARSGKKVLVVDADPDANLASAFGVPYEDIEKIKPIAEMADLIEERTGARPGAMGGVFKLNPKVDDVADECGYDVEGVRLLVMGKSKAAASGCYCPENIFLKRLLKHLVVDRNEVVIVDMEAGIEHLTRGTAGGVDAFVVVVEPGKRSIQTALAVRDMAKELGISRVYLVANKVRDDSDVEFIKDNVIGMNLIGSIGFNSEIVEADMKGIPPFKNSPRAVEEVEKVMGSIETLVSGQ